MIELDSLFEMAAAAARNAERNCTPTGATPFYEGYGGYPAYVSEYNRLIPMVWKLFGDDAQQMFPPIDLGKDINPASVIGAMWKTYAELAAARLSTLAGYLKSKQGRKLREYEEIIDLIDRNLRPAMFTDPENERQVQEALETIFRVRALDFRREQRSVPYSSKRYIPDFTFDALGVAIEVKLCNRTSREKELIDEINADIVGYQGAYDKIVFVIYDLGFIRDTALFRSGIEQHPGVTVQIVKK